METGDDKTSVDDKQETVESVDTSTTAPSFTEQLIQQVHQIKNDVDSAVESTLDASVTYKTEIEEETSQNNSLSEENKSSEDQKTVESESTSSGDQAETKSAVESEKVESNASPSEPTATESVKEAEPKVEENKDTKTESNEEKKDAEKVTESPEQKQDDNKETLPAEVPEQSVDTKQEADKEQKEEQVSTEVKQEEATPTETVAAAATTASNESNVNQLARTVSTPSNESDAAIAQILLRLQVLLQRQNGLFTTPLAAAAKAPTAATIQPPSDILIYNVLQQLLQRYGSASLPPLNPATQTIVHENDTRQVLHFLRTVINTDTGSSSSNDPTFNNSVNLDQVNRVLTHLIEIHQTEQANRPSEDLDPSLIKQVLQLLLQSFASTVAITNARNSNELNFFRCSSCQKVFVQVSYRFNKQ